jgi:hypothetical protein
MRHGRYERAGSGGGGGSSGGGERAFSWRHCSVRGRGDGDGGGRHGAGAVRPIARRMAPLATFTFTLATFTFTLATFTFTFTLASGLAPPFARFVALVALVTRSRRRAMMLALGSAMMLALSLALPTALVALERPMRRFRQQRAQPFAHVIDGARDGVVEAPRHVTEPFAHLLAEVIEPLGPIPEHIREQVGAVLAWLLAALAAPAAVLCAVAGAFGLGLGRDAEEVGAA